MYEWFKDGDKIDYTWPYYVTRRNTLKIKSASFEDAGTFVCKGVNGFGKSQVNIELIVLGNELLTTYLFDVFDQNNQ